MEHKRGAFKMKRRPPCQTPGNAYFAAAKFLCRYPRMALKLITT